MTKEQKHKRDVEIAMKWWQDRSVFHPDNISYEVRYIPEYEGVLASFNLFLYADELRKEKIACSIWDAFKIKYFPGFLLKKFPARVREINVDVIYPQVHEEMPENYDLSKMDKYLTVKSEEKLHGVDCKI